MTTKPPFRDELGEEWEEEPTKQGVATLLGCFLTSLLVALTALFPIAAGWLLYTLFFK